MHLSEVCLNFWWKWQPSFRSRWALCARRRVDGSGHGRPSTATADRAERWDLSWCTTELPAPAALLCWDAAVQLPQPSLAHPCHIKQCLYHTSKYNNNNNNNNTGKLPSMPAFQAPTGSNRWHSSLMAPLTLQPQIFLTLWVVELRLCLEITEKRHFCGSDFLLLYSVLTLSWSAKPF